MKVDGRTKQARLKKWIKEQKAFGKRLNISPSITNQTIKMRSKGYNQIAGLDKKGIDHMNYKNSNKIKILKTRLKDYYSVWRKK